MMLTIADPLLCLAGHHHLGGRPDHAITAIAGAVACDVGVAAWGGESRDSNGIGLQRCFASAMWTLLCGDWVRKELRWCECGLQM
jgi:hypothetical protein